MSSVIRKTPYGDVINLLKVVSFNKHKTIFGNFHINMLTSTKTGLFENLEGVKLLFENEKECDQFLDSVYTDLNNYYNKK